ncbi:MAG: matrixin family metalloprotease, partial [Gammaproteobacteria bacterium]
MLKYLKKQMITGLAHRPNAPPEVELSTVSQVEYLRTDSTPAFNSQTAISLTEQALAPVLEEAIRIWESQGLNDPLLDRLANLEVDIADMPDGTLGEASGNTIQIDNNADGYGWFVDSTPTDSSEFQITMSNSRILADADSDAFGRIDLLTVLVHEVGHVLGLGHDSKLAIMGETFGAGQRLILEPGVLLIDTNGAIAGYLDSSGGTLAAEITDTSPITFEIVDDDGNAIPDIQVGGDTYNDIDTIIGRTLPGDEIVVAIDDETTWTITGQNSGTVKVGTYNAITFSRIENITGAATAKDNFIFEPAGDITGEFDDRVGDQYLELDNGFITIGGDAEFIFTHRTVDADTDGNGEADLIGASLNTFALSVTDVLVDVDGVGSVTLTSGDLGLATLSLGSVRYTALKMNNVVASASTATDTLGFAAAGLTLNIDSINKNGSADDTHLNWAGAFDLNGDGLYGQIDDDLLDPGKELTGTPDLKIDYADSMRLHVLGSVTGTLVAGPVEIDGAADFALERRTVDVDTDGNGVA